VVTISVKDNFPEVKRLLAEQHQQVPFALAVALNKTAEHVKSEELIHMQAVFDRPTKYTMSSLYVKRATKQKPEARVWVKDSDQPNHYLLPQIYGGNRPLKRLEVLLVRIGAMRSGERAVPGAGARLDAYGNMSRGQIQQILGQLKAFYLAGASQNATGSKRSRAKRAKEAYFVSTGVGTHPYGSHSWLNGRHSQHLPRGVWSRNDFGAWGSAIKPVLIFVGSAKYRRRFEFFEVSDRTVERHFGGYFDDAFAHAMRTARPAGDAK